MEKLNNSILQQPPTGSPPHGGRAPGSGGLGKEPPVEDSVPHPILREMLNHRVSFPLSRIWRALVLKGSAVPAGGFCAHFHFHSPFPRAFSECYFPNNPKDAVRESGVEKSWGQYYRVQATLGVGLPRESSPTPHGLSNNPTPPPASPVFFL